MEGSNKESVGMSTCLSVGIADGSGTFIKSDAQRIF